MKSSLAWLLAMALFWSGLGLKAQDSIYKMATWRTQQQVGLGSHYAWSEFQYERDTVLSGETYWVFDELIKNEFFGTWTQYHRKSILQIDSGVIRYWDHVEQKAFTYMDFNALPGDEWVITASDPWDSNSVDGALFRVSSAGMDTIQGVPTRWIQGHMVDSNYYLTFQGKFYEFLGGSHGFLEDIIYYVPRGWSIEVSYRRKVCHENPLHGLVLGPAHLSSKCQLFDQLSLETPQFEGLTIYPNPSSKLLYLKGSLDQFTSFSLIDLSGCAVLNRPIKHPENGTMEVDISAMPAGVYTVQLQSTSGQMIYRRVVKY